VSQQLQKWQQCDILMLNPTNLMYTKHIYVNNLSHKSNETAAIILIDMQQYTDLQKESRL
jgi:hypothetical protein